ncbi:MAG: hypothetical protein P8P26_09520 [Porticoccaceae bacterium]|nr:hypothetical protein [Porticoccaceae bacterium]
MSIQTKNPANSRSLRAVVGIGLALLWASQAEADDRVTVESLIADFNEKYSLQEKTQQSPEQLARASAEQKLEAIKQALVDLALDTDLRLNSASFLDSLGVLHESSVLSTDSQISGVRVLDIKRTSGIDIADIVAQLKTGGQACPGARPNNRREAIVSIGSNVTNAHQKKRIGDHYLQELTNLTQEALIWALLGSPDWSLQAEKKYASAYDRFLTGTKADNVRYRFDIVLRAEHAETEEYANLEISTPIERDALVDALSYGFDAVYNGVAKTAEKIPALSYSKPWPKQKLSYELILTDRQQGTPLWRKILPLDYPAVPRGYSKSPMPEPLQQDLAQVTAEFIAEVTEFMECQEEFYRLERIPGSIERVNINAGAIAGIKVGDQFLISADKNILNESLSMPGLAGLGLAEVSSVTAHTATLKYVAGPDWSQRSLLNSSVAMHF